MRQYGLESPYDTPYTESSTGQQEEEIVDDTRHRSRRKHAKSAGLLLNRHSILPRTRHHRAVTAGGHTRQIQTDEQTDCETHLPRTRPSHKHIIESLSSISRTSSFVPRSTTQVDKSKIITVTKAKLDFPKLVLEKVESNIHVDEKTFDKRRPNVSREEERPSAMRGERSRTPKARSVIFERDTSEVQKAIKQHIIAKNRKYTYESHSVSVNRRYSQAEKDEEEEIEKKPEPRKSSSAFQTRQGRGSRRKHVTWSAPTTVEKPIVKASHDIDDPDRLMLSEQALYDSVLRDEEVEDRLDVLWSRGRKGIRGSNSAGVLRKRRARDLHPVTTGLAVNNKVTTQKTVGYRVLPEELRFVKHPVERASLLEQILRARALESADIGSGMSLGSFTSSRSVSSLPNTVSLTTLSRT